MPVQQNDDTPYQAAPASSRHGEGQNAENTEALLVGTEDTGSAKSLKTEEVFNEN